MAFGFLNSIIPEIEKNVTLYTSPTDTLTQGKVSISSKNYNPVKIRILLKDGNTLSYLEYDRYINYGEVFQTDEINVGSGQSLLIRSSSPDVNFVFNGSTIDESGANLGVHYSGYLNSVISTDNVLKQLYTVPQNINAYTTLVICNLNSFPSRARISISDDPNFDSSNYIEYDVEIAANQTYIRTGIYLGSDQRIKCSSSNGSKLQFTIHGRLRSTLATSEDDINVVGNAYIAGNLGVGTFPRVDLDIIGNSLLSGNVNIGGDLSVIGEISGTFNSSDVSDAILQSGALPSVDGSALTGIVAQGTGIVIKDSGVSLGSATIVDFGKNISGTFSSGVSTVSLSNTVDILNTLKVNTNKFIVEGSTGNTTIVGNLTANSNVTIGGQIDVLNNNIVNVGYPTTDHHAVSKSYVDSKTTAMSIALS